MKLSTKHHPSVVQVSQLKDLILKHKRLVAIAALATLSFHAGLSSRSVVAAQDSPKAIVDMVWQLVHRDYVDGTFNQQDWFAVRRKLLGQNYTSREQAYSAIRQALKSLGDEYTRFLDPQQSQSLFSQTLGEISGIGIRMRIDPETSRLTIIDVIDSSPAMQAGLQSGDEIVAIDGQLTKGLKIEAASQLIRGRTGTSLDVRVARSDQNLSFQLVRAKIEVPSVTYQVKQEGDKRIGFIRLDSFSAKTSQQAQQAILDLSDRQVDRFVLDLRGNPGGLLDSSIEIARMWLDRGTIVKTSNRRGLSIEAKANNRSLTDLPLAILIDNRSASASEILAGALQDNQRAIVIGSPSFGKALVQQVHRLADGSSVAITTSRYYTPMGKNINKKGIIPDVRIDLSQAQLRQLAGTRNWRGSKNDPVYVKAVSVLTNYNFAQPHLDKPQAIIPKQAS